MIHSLSEYFPNLASSLARNFSSEPIYGLLWYCNLSEIFSNGFWIWYPALSSEVVWSRKLKSVIDLFWFVEFFGKKEDEVELGGVCTWTMGVAASRIKRRESKCVGGLLSRRESEIHQVPSCSALKNFRHHRRPFENRKWMNGIFKKSGTRTSCDKLQWNSFRDCHSFQELGNNKIHSKWILIDFYLDLIERERTPQYHLIQGWHSRKAWRLSQSLKQILIRCGQASLSNICYRLLFKWRRVRNKGSDEIGTLISSLEVVIWHTLHNGPEQRCMSFDVPFLKDV